MRAACIGIRQAQEGIYDKDKQISVWLYPEQKNLE